MVNPKQIIRHQVSLTHDDITRRAVCTNKSSSTPTENDLQGYLLFRQSSTTNSSSSVYKKRWFRFASRSCTLHYYKSSTNDQQQLGEIQLELAAFSIKSTSPFRFAVIVGTKLYDFEVNNSSTGFVWVKQLQLQRNRYFLNKCESCFLFETQLRTDFCFEDGHLASGSRTTNLTSGLMQEQQKQESINKPAEQILVDLLEPINFGELKIFLRVKIKFICSQIRTVLQNKNLQLFSVINKIHLKLKSILHHPHSWTLPSSHCQHHLRRDSSPPKHLRHRVCHSLQTIVQCLLPFRRIIWESHRVLVQYSVDSSIESVRNHREEVGRMRRVVVNVRSVVDCGRS